jgi:gliding motility-associated-like protein
MFRKNISFSKYIKFTLLKTNSHFMRILLLFFLWFSLSLNAQITINAGGTAASIVNTLVTNGITITNPTINCGSTSYGTYSGNLQAGGTQLSNGGILLTTGSATAADGPNTTTATSTIVTGYDFSDPNLTTQPGAGSPAPALDNCVLEFDMKPSCSQFIVSYVFGSDEYPEFVSSTYNDGFGIFITGPNPAGGTYNAYNMARLPNGQLVSIDNVNATTNATYYNLNTNNVTSYDAYTDGLTGSLSVVPCSTYHVKIIIADAGDESFDSGLFLGAGSFTCSAPALTTAASPASVCTGQASTLTATPSSTGGTYSWTSSPAGFTSPAQTVTVNPTVTTTYTCNYTLNGCAAVSSTVTVTVTPSTTPTFTQVGPYCSGATIPALPTTSNNSIPGTWSPAINNTTTTTYTFTPSTGQCISTQTMTITINPSITPTFTPVGPYCSGATIPALPTASNEGINGSWSPAINNTTTTTYTFTPTAGQCGLNTTMTITITPNTTPTFTQVGPFCAGATIAALPTTSNESVPGTWSPSINNTTTTNYTFSPTAGQCALNQTMTITINSQTLPSFSQLGAYCQNDTPGTLPTTSNNSISGTWNPATISTLNAGSTTYTFTPDTSECATTNTMTVVVNPLITPTFTQLGAYCQNASPGNLPLTSTNSISGTWNPATISTSNTGSATYTFTPSLGQCGLQTTMTVSVNAPGLVPTFNQVGPYCQNSSPGTLPTTSTNSVTGTWSPSTISTSTAGTTTYTFNVNPNQCAVNTTMSVTVNPTITPLFTQLGSYCQNSTPGALQTTSTNSITGTWSPAIISTSNAGNATYTFTPNGSVCATQQTMTIVTDPQITPTFSPIGPLCQNSAAPALNNSSTNGINGTWSPSSVNTTTVGNTTYTFTPNTGQCAINTTLTINILAPITPTFTQLGPFCQNATPASLPTSSSNNPGITGSWNPALISTSTGGSTTYTFTPASTECATSTSMTVAVIPITPPTFSADITSGCSPLNVVLTTQNIPGATYTWTSNNGNIGLGSNLQTTFSNGGCYDISLTVSVNGCSSSSTLNDYICAENSPIAAFMSNPMIFTNTSENVNFTNNSVGATSYSWDFGDGASSIQTNPSHNYSNITGNFLVTLTAISSLGCTDEATMILTYQETTVFYVPNSFTPDQDEFNQTWGPVFTSGFDPYNFDLYIFDRWGELVWESHDANARWDGTYGSKGNKALDGIYTYRINYKPKETDKKFHLSGHITLIR